jgi:hypothetical protein
MGRTFRINQGHTMRDLMEKAGFVDIVEKKVKVPLHGWPKNPKLRQAGFLGQAALDQSLDGFGLLILTQILGWSAEEAAILTAKMRAEIRKKSNYSYTME